ncbi:hypothetical protein D910_00619 [Dendroctonus ponderosae]|uniref:Laminin G domain-containing protein n=1 Tax=Dendroctonus ponderosae TaxID=77166 RepID=U4TUD9_DENPD|nr:hypothetical protein D910_00619 [Dendroctonus ponderosae]
MVSDGQYHIAELIAIKKNFTLRVDRGLARSIINDGSKDYLKLTTPMYLGGIPPDPGEHAFTDWHLRNLTSFSGCMREVWINHKQVDFGNAKTQQKVQPGCGITEDKSDDELQKSDAQAVEGVKLTFLVPNETESGEHLNGLVVQHIDESEFEHDKKERFVLYHDKQCLLSAFLYFTTITSFVYLALIWIKQRMHVHLDQFQLW